MTVDVQSYNIKNKKVENITKRISELILQVLKSDSFFSIDRAFNCSRVADNSLNSCHHQ